VRVVVAFVVGVALMVQFEPVTVFGLAIPAGSLSSFDALGLPLGPLGLAVGASLGAWIEWVLLKRALAAHVGVRLGAGAAPLARMFAAASAAAAGAYAAGRALTGVHALLEAAVVAAVLGALYLALALALRLPEARAVQNAIRRSLRR
jgi:hypothetical protein